MTIVCSAVGCKSRLTRLSENDQKISFHRFPKNEELKETWVRNMRKGVWQPTIYSRLCSLHFESSCYQEGFQRKVLHSYAVPTIFNDQISKKCPKKRRLLYRSDNKAPRNNLSGLSGTQLSIDMKNNSKVSQMRMEPGSVQSKLECLSDRQKGSTKTTEQKQKIQKDERVPTINEFESCPPKLSAVRVTSEPSARPAIQILGGNVLEISSVKREDKSVSKAAVWHKYRRKAVHTNLKDIHQPLINNSASTFNESWSGCASGKKRKIKLPEGKVLISRVYHFLCDEYEQLKALCPGCDLSPLSDLVARTSKATGVSLNIVTDILLEEKRAQQPADSDDDVSPMEEEPSEGEEVEAPEDTAMTETQEQEDEDKETQEATFNLMTETPEQEDEVEEQTQATTYIEQPEDEEIETLKVEIYDDEYQCSAGEAAGDDSHVTVKTEPPDEQLTLSSVPSVDPLAAEVPHAEVKVEPHTEYPSKAQPSGNIGDRSPSTRDTKRQKLGT